MTSTVFSNGQTVIQASWLNDVNIVVYSGFSNYASIATTLSYSDTGILGNLISNTAGYNQLIVQNRSSATNASTSFVASNNIGTASTFFIELGINSSTFTGTGPFNQPSYGYVVTMSSDLAIGTYTANAIHLIANGNVNTSDALTVLSTNNLAAPTLQASSSYANDAAAAAGGVPVGGLYRNGSVVQIRIS